MKTKSNLIFLGVISLILNKLIIKKNIIIKREKNANLYSLKIENIFIIKLIPIPASKYETNIMIDL